jgi:signal transduction histidine kinase/ligand-binding sensor domain-containing protein
VKSFQWHITPTVLLLLITVTAWCQGAKTVILTKYTQSEGLSSYYITKIIRDAYGFMWVGTQEGLNRFDGKTFQVFSKQSIPKHRLVSSYVADLAEDTARNQIWVLTSYAGINAININTRVVTQQITLDRDRKPLSEKWVRCLYVKGDTLWLGGHGILAAYSIKTNNWLDINIEQKIGMRPGECNISKITYDRHGRLWVFSDGYGIAVLNNRFELINTFRNELANGFYDNRKLRFWDLALRDNMLYVATSWGLRLFTTGSKAVTYVPNRTKGIPDRAEIQSITFSSANTLLFATTNRFYSLDVSTRQLQTWYDENKTDDWLSATYQIVYDSAAQKVWIGTQPGLASFSLRKTAFTPFSKSFNSETTMRHAFSVLPATEETIYSGNENGLFHINALTKEIIQISNASSNLLLFKDAPGNVFVSNKKGFFLLKDKKIQPARTRFPCLQPLENDQLSCGMQFNDSLILFGSIIQKGLTVWNTRSNQIKIYHKDSVQNTVEGLSIIDFLYKSRNGKAFILTEKSVIDFNPITGHYTTYTITDENTGTVLSNFMDMCETADSYWIATYGNGLIETDKRFRIKRIIATSDGLSNNCVYRTFSFRDSFVIATTNYGLSVINCVTNHIRNSFQSDGLQSDFFEQLCGYQSGNKIYAGGVNGFTIIEPEYFYMNRQSPKLYLDNIKIETKSGITDTSNFSLAEITIPNNALQTTITFSALNYPNPVRVAYAYKIAELNSDWINLGSRNFFNLIGLAPGKYTMLVRASNEDGIWNETPLQLSLLFLPQWYQTGWFKLLVLLITAALLYSLVRYRISQIKKQQQIRKEIANDLHDDIGSTLNTVKIFTHLAKREPQNEDHLNQIEESITQATYGLRDMIWVLDDNEDTIFELLERIKKFALPVCQANHIHFTCTYKADKNGKPISKTEKRNLLLIAKEAINNSIKYANCSHIQVVAKQETNQIHLLISDDGSGFEQSNVIKGNGLSNIQYRANQISYKLHITSTIGKGTMVELKNDKSRGN